MQKILFYSFLVFAISCNNNSANDYSTLSEEPVEMEKSDFVSKSTAVSTPPPETLGKVQEVDQTFATDESDAKKYQVLKSGLETNKKAVNNFLARGKNRDYKNISQVSVTELSAMSTDVLTMSMDDFIQKRNLNKANFLAALNTTGLTLGFSLISEFGNKRNEAEFYTMRSKVLELLLAKVITDKQLLRMKVAEAELNSKWTPARGAEGFKTTVDENGNVYINMQ